MEKSHNNLKLISVVSKPFDFLFALSILITQARGFVRNEVFG